jgi:hypothetical protein
VRTTSVDGDIDVWSSAPGATATGFAGDDAVQQAAYGFRPRERRDQP